jgi:hypothetical protein
LAGKPVLPTIHTTFGGLMDKPRQTIASGKTVTQQVSDAFDAALDEEPALRQRR